MTSATTLCRPEDRYDALESD